MTKYTKPIIDLQKPEAFRWVLSCILNWLVIGLSFYIVSHFQNIWSVILAILVIGNRQHAIALLGHEGAHYMLSSNQKWNDFLTGFFAFWPLGINLPGYRDFHFAHHQNVGSAGDPELKHKKMNYPEFDLPLTRKKIFLYFIKDIFFFSTYEVVQLISFIVPRKKIHLLTPNLFMALIILPLIYFGYFWVVILWFMANISSFWAFFRIRVYIEHIGTSATHRIQSNPFLNFIFFPYGADTHWEHHEWPNMLWYNRSKARLLFSDIPLVPVNELLKSYDHQSAALHHKHQSHQPLEFLTPINEQK